MNKTNLFKILPIIALVFMSQFVWGANPPVLGPVGNQTAMVGELFTLDLNALFADPAETYELLEARPGMTVNPSTGVISWTPSSIQDGGLVIVRAYNSAGESVQQFVIYVADAQPIDATVNSYWKLDETSGSTFTDNVGYHHATAYTPVSDTIGVVNNAQVLNPINTTSELLKVNDSPDHKWDRNESFTFSFWCRWAGGGVNTDVQILLTKGGIGDYKSLIQFYLKTDDVYPRIGFQLKNGGTDNVLWDVRSYEQIVPNQWYHVVGTYQGTAWPTNAKMTLQVNGESPISRSDLTFSQYGFESDNPLSFGSWGWYGNTYPFSGSMDEIVIWNKALNSTEVNQVYADGLSGKPQYPKPGNYAPLFSSSPITDVTENMPYNYATTVSDYEGDGMTRSASTLPSWLTFNTVNGLLSGTPGSEDVGDNLVVLNLTDGTTMVSQQFMIAVANVDEAPVIISIPDPTTIDQDEEFTYTVEVEDNDPGAVITLTGLSIPDWMTFNPSTGVLSGTPTNDQTQYSADSTFDISIEARDNTDLFDTQEFSLTVININDAPVIISQNPVSTDRNVPLTLDYGMLNVVDVDNHYPEEHTLTIKTGTNYTYNGLVLTPAQNYYGDLLVNIELSDGEDEVEYAMAVTVNFVNNPPLVISKPVMDTVKVAQTFAYVVVAIDPEGDPLTYIPTSIPSWLSWEPTIKVLTGKPEKADIGKHTVIITISDGSLLTNYQFDITVISQYGVGLAQVTSLTNNIYPNPADQYVVFDVMSSESLNIEITDLSGKTVVLEKVNGAGKHTLDVSSLNSGLYLYRVYNEGQEQTGKLIIK